jgi:hypothetical protein
MAPNVKGPRTILLQATPDGGICSKVAGRRRCRRIFDDLRLLAGGLETSVIFVIRLAWLNCGSAMLEI